MSESVAISAQIDQAMGRVREEIALAESVMYATGICTCSAGFFARLILSGPTIFSTIRGENLPLRKIYVNTLIQLIGVLRNFLFFPAYAEIFRHTIPPLYVNTLKEIAARVTVNPSVPDDSAREIRRLTDELMASVGYETIFVKVFANLKRIYATDAAFNIDLLQFLASLLNGSKDEFEETYTFLFGTVPPGEEPKTLAGVREVKAFLSAFNFTPELFRELSFNPLFGRADLAESIKKGVGRIPDSFRHGSEFREEGEQLWLHDYYATFHGPKFLFRLLFSTLSRVCEFQIHIATRAKRDAASTTGGQPIGIPEEFRDVLKLMPPNDWGYYLAYAPPERLFSPTHAAWARRARHIAGFARHPTRTVPGDESNSTSLIPDAWDVDSHAITIAKGVGRRPTDARLTEEDRTDLYESGIRALQPFEFYGDHLGAYLFEAGHDYMSHPRDASARYSIYMDNVLLPPTEFLVDSYYQSTFLPSRLVPAAIYGKDEESENSSNRPVMRARHKRIPVSTARTAEELADIVEQTKASLNGSKTLLYRGQVQHYSVQRAARVAEFLYGDPSANELSLTTTASRVAFPFESFLGRFQLYLQGLLYRDVPAKSFAGITPDQHRGLTPFANIYLSMIYRTWRALYCESQWDILATGLAQHYGIPTNGLDLTASLDVAVWFATYRMFAHRRNGRASHWYTTIDSWAEEGSARPVIYLIAVDTWLPRHLETLQDQLPLPQALRPERQEAYLHYGGWGLQSNACAEDVVQAIFLAPGFRASQELATDYLFPNRQEDDFYDALLELKANTASETDSLVGYQSVLEFREPLRSLSTSAAGAKAAAERQRLKDQKTADELGEQLFNAVNTERFEEAARLIDAGANINFKGQMDHWQGGGTALHWAALYGNVELVRLLLERDADVNVSDNLGRTPLFPAAANSHVEVVRLLLEHGADVRAMSYRGWQLIPPERRHPEVVKLLKEYGEGALDEIPARRRRIAKAKLVTILKRGVITWNAMRLTLGDLAIDLSGTNLRRADLIGANLSSADLRGVSFVEANLMGANLRDTDLSDADFEAATLTRVDFRGAKNLDQAKLADVYWDKKPKWPKGFKFKEVNKRYRVL